MANEKAKELIQEAIGRIGEDFDPFFADKAQPIHKIITAEIAKELSKP